MTTKKVRRLLRINTTENTVISSFNHVFCKTNESVIESRGSSVKAKPLKSAVVIIGDANFEHVS
jgi:hypothetical protein